jgi:hypothetical protein
MTPVAVPADAAGWVVAPELPLVDPQPVTGSTRTAAASEIQNLTISAHDSTPSYAKFRRIPTDKFNPSGRVRHEIAAINCPGLATLRAGRELAFAL